jgi:hypothetical protein
MAHSPLRGDMHAPHQLDSTRFGRLAYIRAGVGRQSSSIIEVVAVDVSRQLSGSHIRSQMPASMSSSNGSMCPDLPNMGVERAVQFVAVPA